MPPPERLDEDVHPLTRDWADRINNRNVRAAFLQEPIDSYTTAHDLRVWTGTWNTNGRRPSPDLDITPWLDVSSRPDLVVVGFQEIVPLTPGKVLMQEDANATGEWEAIIERALNGTVAAGEAKGPPPRRRRVSAARVRPRDVVSLDVQRGTPSATVLPAAAPGRVSGHPSTPPSASPPRSPPPRLRAVATVPLTRLARKQLVGVYITVWATIDARRVSRARRSRRHRLHGRELGRERPREQGRRRGVAQDVRHAPGVHLSHLSAGSKEGDEAMASRYGEIASRCRAPPWRPRTAPRNAPRRSGTRSRRFGSVI